VLNDLSTAALDFGNPNILIPSSEILSYPINLDIVVQYVTGFSFTGHFVNGPP